MQTQVPTGDAALPSPKDQEIRGCTPKILQDKNREFSLSKWRDCIKVASFNWGRGSRQSDERLSPVISTKEIVVNFHGHRQQLIIVRVNLGRIGGKHYYLASQWEVPKWMTEPIKANGGLDWENPDNSRIAHGIGDIVMVQEAWGFEEDGAIADRLRLHGCKVTYFQKGRAPPLACLARPYGRANSRDYSGS